MCFTRNERLKVFYSVELSDYPVIIWDAEKGDAREFLELFKEEEVESPLCSLRPRHLH